MAEKNTQTAPNPGAPASTEAALAAAQEAQKAREKPKARKGTQWICLEDCLLHDGFHYKDDIVVAPECPPHFGPIADSPGQED
ncbi:MAG: hypothetical protein LBU28_07005 [Spirochaetaceae bacterium]|jgi:hypothetical protein|nr:hypothetical protein [Spirochaetaceae bacterium]